MVPIVYSKKYYKNVGSMESAFLTFMELETRYAICVSNMYFMSYVLIHFLQIKMYNYLSMFSISMYKFDYGLYYKSSKWSS